MNVPLVQGTGVTRKKLKRPNCKGTKFSSSPGENKGKPNSKVSYCPYCPAPPGISQADPEKFVHVFCNPKTKTGKCKNGHSWAVGGPSYTSDNPPMWQRAA